MCFVGKGIWDTFVRAAAPPDPSPRSDTEFTVRVGMKGREGARGGDSGSDNVASTPAEQMAARKREQAKGAKKGGKQKQVDPFVYDLQPYKIVHDSGTSFGALAVHHSCWKRPVFTLSYT